ncbi:hypothetical protein SLS62_005754 [Diatrype stigma]|uniref:Cystathionine gamma-synthase n=1 Tax=Diatrype stigma TaxID=117547 RepID=A0AAN9UP17_9PEZI
MTEGCCFSPLGKLPVSSKSPDDKSFIRDRIAACADPSGEVDPDRDVFLYPAGMKAILDVTRAILGYLHHVNPGPVSMVSYGFLYVDTIKILSKFGTNDTIVYGFGSSSELDELEDRLRSGARIGALYTEFPTNPLLTCVDLQRVRRLADRYNFVVVCDDTVGTSVNVEILPLVDVLVTSLTKLFSGACNVMGGSAILNPHSKHYKELRNTLSSMFEDTYFPGDARVMAKNCADFPQRVRSINGRAQAVASLLQSRSDLVKRVYYPSTGSPPETKRAYDLLRRRPGPEDDNGGYGYGYLVTAEFVSPAAAMAFYDALRVAKGPGLGTNFTLACPCTLFAHYAELDMAAGYGVVEHLVRISVGLEGDVVERIRKALDAAEAVLGQVVGV